MERIQRYSQYELFLCPNQVEWLKNRCKTKTKKKVKIKFIHKLNVEF